MSTSGVSVQYHALEAGAADIRNTHGRLSSKLSDLSKSLAPMKASWEGTSSADYQVLQHRWDTAAEDLQAVLVQIGQLIETARREYANTDAGAARMWMNA